MGKKKRPRGRPDSIEVFDTEGLTQARRYAQQGLKINEIAEKFSMSKASLMRAQARTDDPRGPKLKRFLDMGRYHKGDPLGTMFLWIYEQLERLDDVVENEFGDLFKDRIPEFYRIFILGDYKEDEKWLYLPLSKLHTGSLLMSNWSNSGTYLWDTLTHSELSEDQILWFRSLKREARYLEGLLNQTENLNHSVGCSLSWSDNAKHWEKKYAYRGFERPPKRVDPKYLLARCDLEGIDENSVGYKNMLTQIEKNEKRIAREEKKRSKSDP